MLTEWLVTVMRGKWFKTKDKDSFFHWKAKLKTVDREFLTEDEIQKMIESIENSNPLFDFKIKEILNKKINNGDFPSSSDLNFICSLNQDKSTIKYKNLVLKKSYLFEYMIL